MAQNVTVAGASYSDVPSVVLPKTGGGSATFMDTSDANATAGDIASGKTAYVNGTKLTGTASGSTDLIVSLSKNASTGYWEPDKTWSEVSAAIADNKTFVFCIADMTGNSELAADGIVYNGYLLYLVYETLQDQSNNYYTTEYWYNFKSTGVTEEGSYVYYDTSNADATATDILSGKVAFNSSGKVAGSIATKTSSDLTASNLTVTAPAGYYASDATKTLSDANLTAGNIKKDVEIFGVTGTYEGGGGSSVLSGNFTPASNTLTVTISALAGTTLEHFYFKPHGNSTAALNHSVRAIGPGFIEFTSGNENQFASASNSTGTTFNTYVSGAVSSSTYLSLNRTTGVLTTSSAGGSGYFVGGVQYDWWAW